MRFLITLIIASILAFPASSRQLQGDERAALEASLAQFIQAVKTNSMRRIMAAVPPRVVAEMAESAGTTPTELIDSIVNHTPTIMKDVQFTDIRIKIRTLNIRASKAKDGTPILYAFVPARYTIRSKRRDFAVTSSILALRDGHTWYFLRDNGAPLIFFARVYPVFNRMHFPANKVTRIK